MRDVVDMPDRLLDLFIKVCAVNHGRLSKAKRTSHFSKITDAEILRLEEAFRKNQEDFEGDKHCFWEEDLEN